MKFIDQFDDCFTETIIVKRKDGSPDGLNGQNNDLVEKGRFVGFVDYVDTSEKNIADQYVGRILIVMIGKSADVIASGITHGDVVEWNGKKFEVLPPDENTANQSEQGEIKAVYIENIS